MSYKKFTLYELIALVLISLFTALRVNSGSLRFIEISCYLLLLFSLFLDREHLFYLIAFLLPLGNLYKFQSGLMLYSVIVLIYVIKSSLYYFVTKISFFNFPLIILFYSFIVSLLSSTIYNTSIQLQLVFYFHLLFVFFTIKVNCFYNGDSFFNTLYFFVFGTTIVCIMTLLFPSISFLISANDNEASLVNAGFSTVWDFGRSVLISISFLIVLLFEKRILLILALCLSAFLLYMLTTSARFSMVTGLVVLFVAAFFYFTTKIKRNIFLNIFLYLSVPIALYFITIEVYESMTELRGFEASDNGRYLIWNTYITFVLENGYALLLGTGAGTISNIADMLNIDTAHNIILEKIVEFGIFGSILLCLFLASLYNKQSFNLKKNIKFLPLLTFLGTCLTQGTTGCLTFALLLSIFPTINTNNETKKTDNETNNETSNETIIPPENPI